MKRSRVCWLLAVLLIMVMTFAACGAKNSTENSNSINYDKASATSDGGNNAEGTGVEFNNMGSDSTTKADTGKDSTKAEVSNSTALSTDGLQAKSNDKIIKRYNLAVETKNFDNLVKTLNSKINDLGGYIENSQISGQSYDDSNGLRSGDIVARIPSKKTDEFVNVVSDNANVINNSCTTENVTLDYIDSQSRMEALKIEQKRLFALLEKTEDLKSIITLESRLSDIRYEIQNYESQIRIYDNDVEYSTVTLKIQEVDRITPVKEKEASFTERIKDGFSNSIYHISEGLKNFLVWFIVNIPYLLIWGIILFIAVVVVRKIIRKSDQNRLDAIARLNDRQSGQSQQGENKQNESKQDQNTNEKTSKFK